MFSGTKNFITSSSHGTFMMMSIVSIAMFTRMPHELSSPGISIWVWKNGVLQR